MKVLGVGCPLEWGFQHDASAALLVDGRIVAAVEEERFTRRKKAWGQWPIQSVRYCLEAGGLRAADVDVIAFGFSPASFRRLGKAAFREAAPRRPIKALRRLLRDYRHARKLGDLQGRIVRACGLDPETEVVAVDHHVAHAASSVLFSGFADTAYLTVDGGGEIATATAGEAHGGRFETIAEITRPHSLGLYYQTMTDYLGFEPNDGEYKLMGMAPYGDTTAADVSPVLQFGDGRFTVNRLLCFPRRRLRWAEGRYFGKGMVDLYGPPREGDGLDARHANVAAAVQARLEAAVHHLVDHHLGPSLARCGGRLCFAGGVALNVTLNRRLLERGDVTALYVQPAAGDAGVPLGAAAHVAARRGDVVEPMTHAYYGPEYTDAEIHRALEARKVEHRVLASTDETIRTSADLLAAGQVLAWFQGRVEFGPRALGNRSILGHPGRPGIRDEINAAIKFRERWRPFCPSILAEDAPPILGTEHPTPFMNLSFVVADGWKARIPEVVHVDGSVRPQAVTREANPLYHDLIRAFKERTGVPVLLNTSLNRRGEPMVGSPDDALAMFLESGLERLVMGRYLVLK